MVSCDGDAENADFEVWDCCEYFCASHDCSAGGDDVVDEENMLVAERMLKRGDCSEGKDVCYVLLAFVGLERCL